MRSSPRPPTTTASLPARSRSLARASGCPATSRRRCRGPWSATSRTSPATAASCVTPTCSSPPPAVRGPRRPDGGAVQPRAPHRLPKLEVIDRSVIGASMAPSRDIGLMVFNVRAVARLAHLRRGDHQRHRAEPRRRQQRQGRRRPHRDAGCRASTHLTLGVNAQTGEQPAGDRHRVGIDLNYEGARVSHRGRARGAAPRLRHDGRHRRLHASSARYKHRAQQPTPHYAGYELAARYVDVDDDAVALTSHQLQAGGTYFVTPQLRVQSNVILPDRRRPAPPHRPLVVPPPVQFLITASAPEPGAPGTPFL